MKKIFITAPLLILLVFSWPAHADTNLCVDIKTRLQSTILDKVNNEIAEVCKWLDQYKDDPSYQEALSSIKSHALLHAYAAALSRLKEAQPDFLLEELSTLMKDLPNMRTPIGAEDLPPEQQNFQKINRNLFSKFDVEADKILKRTKGVTCALPVVEYAENVISGLNFKAVSTNNELNEAKFIAGIRRYSPPDLQKYLDEAWSKVYANIKRSKNNPQMSNEIFKQLTTTLCYPARKSFPVAFTELQHQKEKMSWADATDPGKLNNFVSDYAFNACKKFDPAIKEGEFDWHFGEKP